MKLLLTLHFMKNQFRRASLISIAITIAAGGGLIWPGTAGGESAGSVTLEFPPGLNIGKLYTIPKSLDMGDCHVKGQLVAVCQGRVRVPAGASLMLAANDVITDHGDSLDKLSPDAIKAMLFNKTTIGDEDLAHLSRLTGLQYLDLEATDTSDKGIETLTRLVNLGHLDLSHTMIKGTNIARLGNLKKLEWLNLGSNDLNSHSAERLANLNLPRLRCLAVCRANLTDSDMPYLAKMTNLISLEMSDNPRLTDKGLVALKALKNLAILDLRQTAVTVKGLLALRGLPLQNVSLNKELASAADEKLLKAAFPHGYIGFDQRDRAMPVSVFSPLH
jgi:hypothetical protein